MAKKAVLKLIEAVVMKALPALFKVIKEALDAGEASAKKLRDQPMEVSISFGGKDGPTYSAQVGIEADLPDE